MWLPSDKFKPQAERCGDLAGAISLNGPANGLPGMAHGMDARLHVEDRAPASCDDCRGSDRKLGGKESRLRSNVWRAAPGNSAYGAKAELDRSAC